MRALILAAGKGTRMRSEKAKVLHEISGHPMLAHVLDTLESLGVREIAVVAGAHSDQVEHFLAHRYPQKKLRPQLIFQNPQHGTGHAVMVAEKFLKKGKDDILIWPGDMPLLRTESLRHFFQEHHEAKAAVSVLSAKVKNPFGYGRILRNFGEFIAIREELDATEEERRVCEVNTGVYVFQRDALLASLKKIRPNNLKKEYYLTDTLQILREENHHVAAFSLASEGDALGINSRNQLAEAIQMMNQREANKHLEAGVTLVSPEQTYIEPGVKIGTDTVIYPWTFIEAGVQIGKNCQIGPFAKIRKGTKIEDGCIVGSFVEVNRSKLGKKVYAKHLAYLGDATVGEGSNIGAGTITANYDGKNKHQTIIGKGVMTGSNTVLVAPVTLGDASRTGAGSVVRSGTKVAKGMTAVGVPARVLSLKKR